MKKNKLEKKCQQIWPLKAFESKKLSKKAEQFLYLIYSLIYLLCVQEV